MEEGRKGQRVEEEREWETLESHEKETEVDHVAVTSPGPAEV